jgi:hypothetical protein
MIEASGVTVARQTREDLTAGRHRNTTTLNVPVTIEMLVSHVKSLFEFCGSSYAHPRSIAIQRAGIRGFQPGRKN